MTDRECIVVRIGQFPFSLYRIGFSQQIRCQHLTPIASHLQFARERASRRQIANALVAFVALVRRGKMSLAKLESLCLGSTTVGDEGLQHLTGLAELGHLDVKNTRVTAKGLEQIAKLEKLSSLTLDKTAISDDSLALLSGLKHLATLGLRNTPITDKGLKHLEKIPSLGTIYLHGTEVSEAGIESLHRALPKCRIEK